MTALTLTAANVVPGVGAALAHGIAGATITAGQLVYLDTVTTGKYQLADSNSATAQARIPTGIAVNSAAAGQPLAVQSAGKVTLGAVLTNATAYYLGDTPGTIVPVADLTTGDYPCLLGIAESTTSLVMGIQSPGVSL